MTTDKFFYFRPHFQRIDNFSFCNYELMTKVSLVDVGDHFVIENLPY